MLPNGLHKSRQMAPAKTIEMTLTDQIRSE